MRISKDVIEQIKNHLSIVDVVKLYIPVTKKGKDYWAVCPFHADKNPSMKLNVEDGLYYCFGCKASGNIFTFVMKMDNLTFVEALEKLARIAGVDIVEETPEARRKLSREKEVLKLHKELNDAFVRNLRTIKNRETARALDYIHERGFGDDVIESFSIGWSPNDPNYVRNFCKAKGYSESLFRDTGLFSEKGSSLLRGRITFPIMNKRGEVVGFSGRALDVDDYNPKYRNSRESIIYKKKYELYGFYQALPALKNKDVPVICEGNFDVIALHSAGIRSAVASCGTSFTNEHITELRRYNDHIKTFFDADEAGKIATIKAIPMLLSHGFTPSVVEMPPQGAKDSAEMLQKDGKDALKAVLDKEIDYLDYAIKYFSSKNDLSTDSGKNNVYRDMHPILDAIDSEIGKAEAIKKVCTKLGISTTSGINEYNRKVDEEIKRNAYRSRFETENEKMSALSLWKGTDEPFYETDLMKHLAFSRRTFSLSPEIRRIKYSSFTNPKAATIFSYLMENVKNGGSSDDEAYLDNDDVFLERIEDEEMKDYLSKIRGEAQIVEYQKWPEDRKRREIIEVTERLLCKALKKETRLMQRGIELGADTTMSVGAETIREKQLKEIEIKNLDEKMKK